MAGEPRQKRSVLAPIFGLLIVIILGVIAWVVAPNMIHWLATALPNFAGNELPFQTMRLIFTAVIALLSLIAVGLFGALSAPRDKQRQQSSAAQLERDREALRRRQRSDRAMARKGKGRTEL